MQKFVSAVVWSVVTRDYQTVTVRPMRAAMRGSEQQPAGRRVVALLFASRSKEDQEISRVRKKS